jgi:metal-responsive CopG/Arc/MetJ family transcriptional regulator
MNLDFSQYETLESADKQQINVKLAKTNIKKLDDYVINNKLRSRRKLIELIIIKWLSDNERSEPRGRHDIKI